MDQQGGNHGQQQQRTIIGGQAPPYGVIPNPYQQQQQQQSMSPNKMMIGPNPTTGQAGPAAAHQAYQHIQQQQQEQLAQQLRGFWASQYAEVEQASDFKNHSLPLARIKKIMKADEDVRMISAEAPVVFARACEMFILELTLRSWNHTEENKRRTLQKNDIAAAITRTDIFDFLVDIVPREDLKDEVLAAAASVGPRGGPAEGVPYYYMAQAQAQAQAPPAQQMVGPPPGMIVGKPVMDHQGGGVYGQSRGGYMWPHQHQQPPPE